MATIRIYAPYGTMDIILPIMKTSIATSPYWWLLYPGYGYHVYTPSNIHTPPCPTMFQGVEVSTQLPPHPPRHQGLCLNPPQHPYMCINSVFKHKYAF